MKFENSWQILSRKQKKKHFEIETKIVCPKKYEWRRESDLWQIQWFVGVYAFEGKRCEIFTAQYIYHKHINGKFISQLDFLECIFFFVLKFHSNLKEIIFISTFMNTTFSLNQLWKNMQTHTETLRLFWIMKWRKQTRQKWHD